MRLKYLLYSTLISTLLYTYILILIVASCVIVAPFHSAIFIDIYTTVI